MSKFYATLQSEKSGRATRAGHKYIQATAQTYEGSVSVELREVDGDMTAYVNVGPDSDANPSICILSFKLKDILNPAVRQLINQNIPDVVAKLQGEVKSYHDSSNLSIGLCTYHFAARSKFQNWTEYPGTIGECADCEDQKISA